MVLLEGLNRLIQDSARYRDLLTLEDDEIRVEVFLLDSGERATLIVGEEISVVEGSSEPDLLLKMERDDFQAILEGEADFGALISRARASDVRPINFEILSPELGTALNDVLKAYMTFFFTPGEVKVKELRPELAGEAHGAHPIPIAYWDGLRSAWYHVEGGEVVNEEGEMDPYPQAFIILKGRGTVVIEDVEMELRAGTVVFIPTNSVHQIRAEEDVKLIWLAWQTPP
jgi:mannose-6-phosphate isomerase-like protein (cupin superfamily)